MLGAGDQGRLSYVETACWLQMSRAQVVPAPKLLHGHVEAISHGHQSISVRRLVQRQARSARWRRRYRNNERVGRGKIVARLQLIDKDDLRRGYVVIASDRLQ